MQRYVGIALENGWNFIEPDKCGNERLEAYNVFVGDTTVGNVEFCEDHLT